VPRSGRGLERRQRLLGGGGAGERPPGGFAARNAPTLGYAASILPFTIRIDNPAPGMFVMTPEGGLDHDGAVPNLSDQAGLPFLDPTQMNAASAEQVVTTLSSGPYAALFRRVWGEGAFADAAIAFKRVEDSLAAYERTTRFAPYRSRFDAALGGGTALSALEAQGEALFLDSAKGNCASCHAVDATSEDPAAWPFTTRGYATLGAPRNRDIPASADPAHFDLGLCQAAGLTAALPLGLDAAIYCGAFRVPTLRNVAETAPYMHNGSIATLRDAVAFHVTRDTSPERWYPMVDGQLQPFDDLPPENQTNLTVTPPFGGVAGGTPVLTDGEIDAVVAFLATLSDQP
jgi:cytochrome c peroxidase